MPHHRVVHRESFVGSPDHDKIGLEPAASHWVSTQVVRCVFVGLSPDPLRINHRFFQFMPGEKEHEGKESRRAFDGSKINYDHQTGLTLSATSGCLVCCHSSPLQSSGG